MDQTEVKELYESLHRHYDEDRRYRRFDFLGLGFVAPRSLGTIHADLSGSAAVSFESRQHHLRTAVLGQIGAGPGAAVEIGCGRGGNVVLAAAEDRSRLSVGVDLFGSPTRWVQHQNASSARFCKGNATELPIRDGAASLVYSIEAAHAFPSYTNFLAESVRICRGHGWVVVGDIVSHTDLDELVGFWRQSGLVDIEITDLTQGVCAAQEARGTLRVGDARVEPFPWQEAVFAKGFGYFRLAGRKPSRGRSLPFVDLGKRTDLDQRLTLSAAEWLRPLLNYWRRSVLQRLDKHQGPS
ncbi:MAG: class I SAM-dependent methyltransferase [Acidimicrobiia bacterium]|nr:class I SAM-dependent methyltransferase [Acidimicrobiia bacterium]MBP8180219.1 class I SAM-dependent methyltransferase [Acidimicrobiia bacterium]